MAAATITGVVTSVTRSIDQVAVLCTFSDGMNTTQRTYTFTQAEPLTRAALQSQIAADKQALQQLANGADAVTSLVGTTF